MKWGCFDLESQRRSQGQSGLTFISRFRWVLPETAVKLSILNKYPKVHKEICHLLMESSDISGRLLWRINPNRSTKTARQHSNNKQLNTKIKQKRNHTILIAPWISTPFVSTTTSIQSVILSSSKRNHAFNSQQISFTSRKKRLTWDKYSATGNSAFSQFNPQTINLQENLQVVMSQNPV